MRTYDLGYLRAGLGNAEAGPWMQVIASTMQLAESSPRNNAASAATLRIIPDTTDTTTRRRQFVVAGGLVRGPLRISASDRIRTFQGATYHTPDARLEFGNAIALVSLFGQRSLETKTTRGDAVARLTPIPNVSVAGSFSTSIPDSVAAGGSPKFAAARIEAGVRVFKPWVIAGIITRDTAVQIGRAHV